MLYPYRQDDSCVPSKILIWDSVSILARVVVAAAGCEVHGWVLDMAGPEVLFEAGRWECSSRNCALLLRLLTAAHLLRLQMIHLQWATVELDHVIQEVAPLCTRREGDLTAR